LQNGENNLKRKSPAKKKSKLKLLSPAEPAARDEGPRLIPLDERSKEPSRLEHYLELADTALGLSRAAEAHKKNG
jgi:hypothetical protein